MREEEEGSVAAIIQVRNQHRSADRVAKIVVAKRRPGHIARVVEEIVCIQLVVAEELVAGAVEGIGTALGNHAYLPAAGSAELGGVRRSHHFDFFNRVDTGILLNGDVGTAVHVVGSVNGPVILTLASTVH